MPLDRDLQIKPTYDVCVDFQSAWDRYHGAELILVDIPIGLARFGLRECDSQAKKLLGKYNSRVFLTPPRSVFDCESYEDANDHCRAVCGGRGLMKQLWAIAPSIREVDRVLQEHPDARGVVRECHPEICFHGLSGSMISHNKKLDKGYEARVEVLRELVPSVDEVVDEQLQRFQRKVLARDDVVDALVAAVTARLICSDKSYERTLPENPHADETGLAMEMVYAISG